VLSALTMNHRILIMPVCSCLDTSIILWAGLRDCIEQIFVWGSWGLEIFSCTSPLLRPFCLTHNHTLTQTGETTVTPCTHTHQPHNSPCAIVRPP